MTSETDPFCLLCPKSLHKRARDKTHRLTLTTLVTYIKTEDTIVQHRTQPHVIHAPLNGTVEKRGAATITNVIVREGGRDRQTVTVRQTDSHCQTDRQSLSDRQTE